ncbi:MAG: aldehyde dehydrogenase family protein [Bacteriovoracaceae bacterium]
MKFELKGDYFFNHFHQDIDHSDEKIEKFCPANLEQKLWTSYIKYEHINKIIDSANHGFSLWKKVSIAERINYLKKYQEQLLKRKQELATAIALETGKPLWEAEGEVNSVISKVNVTIEDSLKRIEAKSFPNILPGTEGSLNFKPIGPCFIIGPFNFPCHLAGGQILSALIAGNSIVFKPSEKTIYSAQIMIECFDACGFPEGVINFINGYGETASRIIKEKSIKGVFFTGSKEVGSKILLNTYQDLSKLVALELGGKNTSIVHIDANIDHALVELLNACFLTTGQRCTSTSIVALHRSHLNQFVDRFHTLAKKIIIDHPIDHKEKPFMGPLIDDKALNNYLLYMGMAKREGAEEIMRGKALTKGFKGHYVSPSIHIMEKVSAKSIFLQSEIFGPNCTIIPYDTIDEAIKIANLSEYGLASSIFSSDQNIWQHCLENIETGVININRSTIGASAKLPFGGVKSSGNYRPAAVSMIDSCSYPVATLKLEEQKGSEKDIIGLMK